MARRNLNDLLSFVTVAREGSFTRAAALLGVTQSALSQAISGAASDPIADPYHAQRFAYRGRRAFAEGHRQPLRRDRGGIG